MASIPMLTILIKNLNLKINSHLKPLTYKINNLHLDLNKTVKCYVTVLKQLLDKNKN